MIARRNAAIVSGSAGAQFRRDAFQMGGLLGHVVAPQHRGGGGERREFLGRHTGKPAEAAGRQAPALRHLAGVGLFQLREDALDRVAQSLGGAPAQRQIRARRTARADVVEGQPRERALHVERQLQHGLGLLVAHRPPLLRRRRGAGIDAGQVLPQARWISAVRHGRSAAGSG